MFFRRYLGMGGVVSAQPIVWNETSEVFAIEEKLLMKIYGTEVCNVHFLLLTTVQ